MLQVVQGTQAPAARMSSEAGLWLASNSMKGHAFCLLDVKAQMMPVKAYMSDGLRCIRQHRV